MLYIYTVVKVKGNIPIYKFVESIGHVVYGVATDGKRSIDVVTVNHNSWLLNSWQNLFAIT